ncbi:MAG TPA: FtsX-like permease family protein [Candidatus Dormibacteraeota bacterium]|nr:FtsX-like permease family protein [Candidatus Dormibacteraeota bacterium]
MTPFVPPAAPPGARPRGRRLPSKVVAVIAVAVGVGFSVLLISVAGGVSDYITSQLSPSAVRRSGLVDVDVINTIVALLTVVVTVAMILQTAAATFVLGMTTMRSRREEIALRRQSGVLRSTLLVEFGRQMLAACVLGGIVGEVAGILCGALLRAVTVMPVRFTPLSLVAAFPATVLLALAATLVPAWRAANASPALLRKA